MLASGLCFSGTVLVDAERCIAFMSPENAGYATLRMVSDLEYVCRDFLLAHLDAGEDSVGARVEIDHRAATPLGLEVTIEARVTAVDERRIAFEFSVKDSVEGAGRGTHVRDIKRTEVESTDDIARAMERADKALGGRVKYVHSDGGFWMLKRSIADGKIRALAAGRNLYEAGA
jgi:predicted thioesterase